VIFGKLLQLGNVGFQPEGSKMFLVHPIVAFVQCDAMVSLPDTFLSYYEMVV